MASGKDILLGRIRSGEGLSFGQQLKLSLILSYPAISGRPAGPYTVKNRRPVLGMLYSLL